MAGFPCYKVQLLADGTVLAGDGNTLPPASGTFVTSTVNYSYNAGLHAALVGQPLEVRQACGSLPRALQLFIDRFGEPTFSAARQRRKEDLPVFIAAAQLRHKIPFNQLSLRLQRALRAFFGSYANAEEKAREPMFAAGDEDELEIAATQLDFGFLDPKEGHFTVHRRLLDELPVILRVYVECAARLYGNPREADLIKIHMHLRKLTFHY